jgi:predicted nucleic acid-binding protein
VTVYLLDETVLNELAPTGNANVRTWFAGVSSADLRISAMTLFEKRRGWERRRKTDPAIATAKRAPPPYSPATGSQTLLSAPG